MKDGFGILEQTQSVLSVTIMALITATHLTDPLGFGHLGYLRPNQLMPMKRNLELRFQSIGKPVFGALNSGPW